LLLPGVPVTAAVCASCRQPVGDDAFLCAGDDSCTERLERDLGDLGALVRYAVTSYSGMARVTWRPSGVTDPDPDDALEQTVRIQALPWAEGTSKAVRALRVELVGWVRLVVEERRLEPVRVVGPACWLCTHRSCRATRTPGWPADTLPAMAAWLLGQVSWLRHHPDAASCASGVGRVTESLRRAVDRAPELLYAGPCTADVDHDGSTRQCGHDMYVTPDTPRVRCPACRAAYDVEQQRALMAEAADDYLLSAAEIARAVTALHQRIRDDRIRQWAARGRLTARGVNAARAPIYRLGDVLDLLAERHTASGAA
jgi:hypothetical protein